MRNPLAPFAFFMGVTLLAAPPVRVVKAARWLDVAKGTYVSPALVLVDGERIKGIGSTQDIPQGAEILDLGDATLLPGLIDCHTHLLSQMDATRDDGDEMVRHAAMDIGKRTLLGAAMARETVEAGITTVRDLGNSGRNGDVALRDAINAGWVVGPRLFASTRALSDVSGQFARLSVSLQPQVINEYAVVSGVEEARKAVRQALFDGADLIKVILNNPPTSLSLEELRMIVEEAHRAGIKVAIHATRVETTRIAAESGADSVEHAYAISDDTLKLMAQKRIYMVPTDGTIEASVRMFVKPRQMSAEAERAETRQMIEIVQGNAARLMRAVKAGVPIAAGSDMYYRVEGQTRGQASLDTLEAYVEAGMTPLDAIRSATLNAAALLGWTDKIGSLDPGKFADIIAVQGDPLKDIHCLEKVSFVMKSGQVVRNLKPTK